jgi:SAM-dependent methyltransferase
VPGAVDRQRADRAQAERKQRGAWYTPSHLVDLVADAAVAGWASRGDAAVRIVDPSCGDGRFLVAAAERLCAGGATVEAVGVDIDPDAVDTSRQALLAAGVVHRVVHGDALKLDWAALGTFDLVIGNPPFLSQMAAATTRGGSSSRGGGPYADAAVEFLELASELVDATGGRVAYVLPQSLLSARDAGSTRRRYDERASLTWSWWTGERVFDAQVLTCALLFEFGTPSASPGEWSRVITDRRGVPDVPADLAADGTLGDRCRLNANFRDEYYGMVPAVGDHNAGPQLITSGLVDPGHNWWGDRPIRFAKQQFSRPRIDLSKLDDKMTRWAEQRLVPKVLIANQTKILEAVADSDGTTLPGVPVVAAYPTDLPGRPAGAVAWEIAAVLTSPVASAWAWHRSAGTGLSSDAIRVGPVVLADLPWPAGSLDAAVAALETGDVRRCGALVDAAYGVEDRAQLAAWWESALERIEQRQPTNVTGPTPAG